VVSRGISALVSRVPSPPEVAWKVLEQLILPYSMNRRIIVLLENRPVAAETDGDRVSSVTVQSLDSGRRTVLTGSYFFDATAPRQRDCGAPRPPSLDRPPTLPAAPESGSTLSPYAR
jgi:FAD dependent oxidoreductase